MLCVWLQKTTQTLYKIYCFRELVCNTCGQDGNHSNNLKMSERRVEFNKGNLQDDFGGVGGSGEHFLWLAEEATMMVLTVLALLAVMAVLVMTITPPFRHLDNQENQIRAADRESRNRSRGILELVVWLEPNDRRATVWGS